MKKYYVVKKNAKKDDEEFLLETENIEKAKEYAKDEAYYI